MSKIEETIFCYLAQWKASSGRHKNPKWKLFKKLRKEETYERPWQTFPKQFVHDVPVGFYDKVLWTEESKFNLFESDAKTNEWRKMDNLYHHLWNMVVGASTFNPEALKKRLHGAKWKMLRLFQLGAL